ncbi:MAG: hypothetical protein JST91_10145 [Actinobacteria bacterium]|nr:hypothetical protein [Actinomycetota bacterium]
MAEYNAGEGRIRLVPDASGFKRKSETELKKLDLTARVNLEPSNLAQASADIKRWKAQQERDGLKIPVQIDERSIDQATRQVSKLKKDLGGSLSSAMVWNAGALGLGSLPAIATALTSVAGAIQQVTQAGLVLPGVFAGGAASIGTFALGLSGMSDALTAVNEAADGTPEAIEKANKALAGLAPNARDVVTTLADLKPAFDGLRGTVQQNLFAGISQSIKTLADNDLPVLQKGLGGIATAWNGTLKQLGTSLGSDSSKGLLDRILGNTADAQNGFTKAIDPLINGIGTLAAAGTDALPRIADGLTDVAKRFETFITAADQDGRLDKWINDGLDGLTNLGNILLNLGTTFTAITKAAGGGDGLLGTLEKGTKALSDFLNSDAGQEKLRQFFKEGRDQLDKWLPVLENLATTFGSVYNAAKEWTDALLPALNGVLTVLNSIPGGVETVATAFLAWKTMQGVSSLLTSLGNVGTSLLGLPDKANTAAAGINKALALIVVPEIGRQINDQIQQWLKDNFPDLHDANNSNTPDQLGKKAREWVDENILNSPPPQTTAGALPPSAPNSSRPGEVGGIPIPGLVLPSTGPGPLEPRPLPPPRPGTGGPRRLGRGGPRRDDTGAMIGRSGPQPIAPAPGGGGVQSAIGNFVAGLSGPIGNAVSLAQGVGSLAGGASGSGNQTASGLFGVNGLTRAGSFEGNLAGRFSQVPGLFGLFGSLASPDPVGGVAQWGGEALSWLANWGVETGGSALSTLWQGALGMVGLENSILSPSNPWNQAITQTAGGVLDQGGVFGPLMGGDGASVDGAVTDLQRGAGAFAARSGAATSGAPSLGDWDLAGISGRPPGAPSRGSRLTISQVDALAAKFGLTKTSGYRDEPGSFHSTGRAGDYGGTAQQMAQFAAFMATNYPGSLSELIHDSPGFNLNVDEGRYVGPFGQFYTMAQAGYHGDHVHIAVRGTSATGRASRTGGPRRLGTGGPTDNIIQAAQVRPVPRPPVQARQLVPRPTPAPPAVAPSAPRSSTPGPASAAPAAPIAPVPVAPTAPPTQRPVSVAPTAPAPSSSSSDAYMHNISAIDTGIDSAASAIGQAIAAGIGIAAGLGGGAPVPGASAMGALGSLGGYAAGLAQQGGKMLKNVVNVGSSLLVGTLPGAEIGSQDSLYGALLRPEQNAPMTAQDNRRSYTFNGIDGRNVVDDLRLMGAQEAQAPLAAW